ncbi:hypothetical protein AB0D83_02500 [Streptomyces decoyicus]
MGVAQAAAARQMAVRISAGHVNALRAEADNSRSASSDGEPGAVV